ncbi:hypothetical protein TIFTF001_026063 [Ficus carica]|uniref:Uncharacterized protein n=1 Tax=Ficus carica TaxID=3494 RepID=A0AA88ANZ8_FICCA|nr:hypothetical protein TIFTF001_026063 [Ficus carica]
MRCCKGVESIWHSLWECPSAREVLDSSILWSKLRCSLAISFARLCLEFSKKGSGEELEFLLVWLGYLEGEEYVGSFQSYASVRIGKEEAGIGAIIRDSEGMDLGLQIKITEMDAVHLAFEEQNEWLKPLLPQHLVFLWIVVLWTIVLCLLPNRSSEPGGTPDPRGHEVELKYLFCMLKWSWFYLDNCGGGDCGSDNSDGGYCGGSDMTATWRNWV